MAAQVSFVGHTAFLTLGSDDLAAIVVPGAGAGEALLCAMPLVLQ